MLLTRSVLTFDFSALCLLILLRSFPESGINEALVGPCGRGSFINVKTEVDTDNQCEEVTTASRTDSACVCVSSSCPDRSEEGFCHVSHGRTRMSNRERIYEPRSVFDPLLVCCSKYQKFFLLLQQFFSETLELSLRLSVRIFLQKLLTHFR